MAEVVHWGRLADEHIQGGPVPSIPAYSARFRCSELEAEWRLMMFHEATGEDPLFFHALQDRALAEADRAMELFDDVRVERL